MVREQRLSWASQMDDLDDLDEKQALQKELSATLETNVALTQKVSALEAVLIAKDKEITELAAKKRRRTRAHVDTLAQLSALQQELALKEVSFKHELSLRDSTLEAFEALQMELALKEDHYQRELEQLQESFKNTLSMNEESFKETLSLKEASFKRELFLRDSTLEGFKALQMELPLKEDRYQRRVAELQDQLNRLTHELEETRADLAHQRHVKDVYIKKGKETERKLAVVTKYADSSTLSNTNIAEAVRCNIKIKKKKDLQQAYEVLKVAHITCQEKYDAEKIRNSLLCQELERTKLSHQEASQRCESLKHQAEHTATLQRDASLREESLQKKVEELQSQLTAQEDQYNQACTELELLHQEVSQRFESLKHQDEHTATLQRDASLREESLQKMVEELQSKLTAQADQYNQACAELEAKKEEDKPPCMNIEDQPPVLDLPAVPAANNIEEVTVSGKLPEQIKKTSTWKRVRHFLGLKKPQKWKIPQQSSN